MAIAFPGGCLERGLAAGRQDGQRPHEEAAWQVWLTQEAWAPTCMGAFLLVCLCFDIRVQSGCSLWQRKTATVGPPGAGGQQEGGRGSVIVSRGVTLASSLSDPVSGPLSGYKIERPCWWGLQAGRGLSREAGESRKVRSRDTGDLARSPRC